MEDDDLNSHMPRRTRGPLFNLNVQRWRSHAYLSLKFARNHICSLRRDGFHTVRARGRFFSRARC